VTFSPELCDQKRAKSKLGNLINGLKPSRSDRDQNLLGKKDLQGCQHQHIILIRIKDVSSFFHDLRATENIIKRLCAYRSWPRRRYSTSTLSLSIFSSNNFSIHTSPVLLLKYGFFYRSLEHSIRLTEARFCIAQFHSCQLKSL